MIRSGLPQLGTASLCTSAATHVPFLYLVVVFFSIGPFLSVTCELGPDFRAMSYCACIKASINRCPYVGCERNILGPTWKKKRARNQNFCAIDFVESAGRGGGEGVLTRSVENDAPRFADRSKAAKMKERGWSIRVG